MVVLASLASIAEGRDAVVEAGGIPALVETIEDGPAREKEFAVVALLQLCSECSSNCALLVREGAIPPLVALSQSGSARAKHKVTCASSDKGAVAAEPDQAAQLRAWLGDALVMRRSYELG
ncbi:unnamed protein product [Triticum turgidum subsp. durum]|nr:unnamed protein product [Triticum turgidum subsp. durum]